MFLVKKLKNKLKLKIKKLEFWAQVLKEKLMMRDSLVSNCQKF